MINDDRSESRNSIIKKQISKKSRNRLTVIISIVSVCFLGLVVGVGWRTIVEGSNLAKLAFVNQSKPQIFTPLRGSILDRMGEPLALSSRVYTISINPNEVRTGNKQPTNVIVSELARRLKIDKIEIMDKIDSQAPYRILAKEVTQEVKDSLKIWIKEKKVAGVSIDGTSKRFYPNRKLAASVVGFMNSENKGIYGIEQEFEKYLKGTNGSSTTGLDKATNSVDGYDVHLSIDETIQYFAENALAKAMKDNKVKNGGLVIVSDPKTGEILALATNPTFDPNQPYAVPDAMGVNKKVWKGKESKNNVLYLQKNVWKNKAVSDTYEPGSTFKIVVSSAGLEEGAITPETQVNDKTIYVFGNAINCVEKSNGRIHGNETFAESIYNSCNPVMSTLAMDLGLKKFYDYAAAFGFENKKTTGIDLPNEGATDIQEKLTNLDLACAAFGQRLTVTPIQMLMAFNTIANGGTLMKPKIATQITDSDGNIIKTFDPTIVRKVVSKNTTDILRDILVKAVKEGTGKLAYVEGYNIAGKTGTSETTEKDHYVASFAGFAPADNPRISVLVVLDNPTGKSYYGGKCSAPVAGKIIEETLTYLGVKKK